MTIASTPAEIYRELSAKFSAVVARVPDDAWDAPSPCEDWTARQVLQHVTTAERDSVGPAGVQLDPGPAPEDDPLAAWADTRDQLQAVLDDPARADLEFDGFFGPITLATSVENYYCFDLIVHRWDIAKATGGDTAISTAELAFVRDKLDGYGEAMRMPGVFGAELDAPEGADGQTELLAFIGRKA